MHLGYRCRDSGVCCSSGWPIPVERERAAAVELEMASGRVTALVTPWLTGTADTPADVAGTLAIRRDGQCVFHREPSPASGQKGGCAIYGLRPSSCEHFPYICAIDPRGVQVTLSHYCPTAADLLFAAEEPLTIVEGPPVFDHRTPEGLDARESLPPVADGGRRLMGWDEVAMWEREAVSDVAGRAGDTSMPDCGLFEEVRHAVAGPLDWPGTPDRLERAWEVLVVPGWPDLSPVVGRYLASKVFASWALYSGSGLPEVMRAAAMARAVLGVEAARQCLRADRVVDRTLLKEAIRQSDLLLVHYAEPLTLYRL